MANGGKKVIGILTGGGDVPGLNPAIRSVTFRALREGYTLISQSDGVPRSPSRVCSAARARAASSS